ncbi:hypothetical protein VST7929_02708 [Vibrio stylophorae]|uniref:DUF3332 domain-containing protein n=1 Tax=Vibrio stylophorae TaxID=659351 RepID=A0ABM8ZWN0_9VIBR|nr:DUF3332 family protein [Vibrio stylophorae]CAH0534752.1 hypothetical protein VST7929_02708 [Vibrio stylophorae]
MRKSLVAAALATTLLTGCMGQMGLSQLVTKANLSVVDNRYARAGLFMLLSPVYSAAATVDLFLFNTIEFWTGKNIITGKSPAVVDQPVGAIFKVNSKVDSDLTRPPLAKIDAPQVKSAQWLSVEDNAISMQVTYEDGVTQKVHGVRVGEMMHLYIDDVLMGEISQAELQAYAAERMI